MLLVYATGAVCCLSALLLAIAQRRAYSRTGRALLYQLVYAVFLFYASTIAIATVSTDRSGDGYWGIFGILIAFWSFVVAAVYLGCTTERRPPDDDR